MQYQNGQGECRGPGTRAREEVVVGAGAGLGRGQVGRNRVPTEKTRAPEIAGCQNPETSEAECCSPLLGWQTPARMLEILCPGNAHICALTHSFAYSLGGGVSYSLG